jgi:hypothetical protein
MFDRRKTPAMAKMNNMYIPYRLMALLKLDAIAYIMP